MNILAQCSNMSPNLRPRTQAVPRLFSQMILVSYRALVSIVISVEKQFLLYTRKQPEAYQTNLPSHMHTKVSTAHVSLDDPLTATGRLVLIKTSQVFTKYPSLTFSPVPHLLSAFPFARDSKFHHVFQIGKSASIRCAWSRHDKQPSPRRCTANWRDPIPGTALCARRYTPDAIT